MARMVLVRIKRMGKQWASCGVPVSPPENRKGDANIKRLCPKLVPGQVIELPSDHNLLQQDCVEIVRRIERDEFLRPWVFKSADEAAMANPTKSRLGADQIAMGLNMARGATKKKASELEAREIAREEAAEDDDDDFYDKPVPKRRTKPAPRDDEDDDDGEDNENFSDRFAREDEETDENDETANARRSGNRVTKAEADELRERDDEPEEDEQPRRGGRGRSTPSTARTRAPRKPRG